MTPSSSVIIGTLRGIGLLFLFGGLTYVFNHLSGVAGISPELAGVISVAGLAWEHTLATAWGYDLPGRGIPETAGQGTPQRP